MDTKPFVYYIVSIFVWRELTFANDKFNHISRELTFTNDANPKKGNKSKKRQFLINFQNFLSLIILLLDINKAKYILYIESSHILPVRTIFENFGEKKITYFKGINFRE